MAAALAEPQLGAPSPQGPAQRLVWQLWGGLALVLAVAAFTRLYRLDLIDFKSDEARIAGLALDVAQGKWPATSIPTSRGLFNAPLPLYFFGLAALFTTSPAWQVAVSGALDVAAVFLTFVVGRRYFCGRVGLAAAGFYAANAYAAIFARKLAGPFLQPFFAVLLLWCLLELARQPNRRPWLWAVVALLLAVLVQFHFGALLLVPVVVVLFVLQWPKAPKAGLAWATVGLAAGLLVALPYLLYELADQPDVLSRLGSAAGGGGGWSVGGLELIGITLTSPAYGDLTGEASTLFNTETGPLMWLTLLAGLFVLGGLAYAIRRCRDRRYLTVALFVLGPPLLVMNHAEGLQIHYFVFLEPALFLLAGIGFDTLLFYRRELRVPAFAVLAALLVAHALNFGHFTDFAQEHSLAGAYGLPLVYQEQVFQQAATVAASGRIVAGANGRDEADTAGYFLRAHPGVVADSGLGLILPGEDGAYVTYRDPPLVLGSPAFVEPLPGGSERAGVYWLAPGQSLPDVQPQSPPAVWRDGLQLVAYTAPRSVPGRLTAVWRVTAPVDPSTLFFNQLLDVSGNQLFDLDATPLPASQWRAGDTIVTFADATPPAGFERQAVWWSIGVYDQGGRRVLLTNGDLQLRLARLKGGQAATPPQGLKPSGATFGGGALRLDGYKIDSNAVTLVWSDLKPVDGDYTVFVHGEAGQADSQPAGGRYPTSLWDSGETVVDRHELANPSGVEVGLYDLQSGQRLKLDSGGDSVPLAN